MVVLYKSFPIPTNWAPWPGNIYAFIVDSFSFQGSKIEKYFIPFILHKFIRLFVDEFICKEKFEACYPLPQVQIVKF